MFHKVRWVIPQEEMKLLVQFGEGTAKIYDVTPLVDKWPQFAKLRDESLFSKVRVDTGGYGIVWNDDLDLSCDELFAEGKEIASPFDNLMAMGDATAIWGLNESTLRQAIRYGKLQIGQDVCKFGKQWVVTREAMEREYGMPPAMKLK